VDVTKLFGPVKQFLMVELNMKTLYIVQSFFVNLVEIEQCGPKYRFILKFYSFKNSAYPG